MAVRQQSEESTAPRKRQFVVRLDQPGLYDDVLQESARRTIEEGRSVPMTEIAREALEEKLTKKRKKR